MVALWQLNSEHLEIFQQFRSEVGYYPLNCIVYRSYCVAVLIRYLSFGITVQLHLQHIAVFVILDHTDDVYVKRFVIYTSIPIFNRQHPCVITDIVHSVYL